MVATDDRAWAREAIIADVEDLINLKPCASCADIKSKASWKAAAMLRGFID